MIISKKDTGLIKTFEFGGLTREEARKIRRQKELERAPTLENRFKRAKRNTKRRELRKKYKVEISTPPRRKKKLL